MVAPVTNRGDCIGVLDLSVPYADDAVREAVAQAAHALAYIVVTDRRFTDLYHWGRRTTAVSLAAEIQHQLLPSASCCEAAQFTPGLRSGPGRGHRRRHLRLRPRPGHAPSVDHRRDGP